VSDLKHQVDLVPSELYMLLDALDEVTGDKGREYRSPAAPRFDALRKRLAEISIQRPVPRSTADQSREIRELIQSQGWHEDSAVDLMVEYLRKEAENLRLVHAHDAVDALVDHIVSLGMARGLIAFLQDASKERNP
jgi:hypothetical protein